MAIKRKTMVLIIAGLFLFVVHSADAASTKTPFTSVSAQATYNALTAVGSTGVMFDTRTADEYYGCGQPWNANNGVCTKPDAYNGTPKWIVSGVPDAIRLPFNVPYWYAGVVTGTGAPEDEAMVRSLIEELLAAGTIDFNAEIYLLCRTAYRSYYMADWMDDQTFYNARTGTTEYFSKLINIDADGTPGGGQGGMQEWNAQGLPRWSNYGDKTMPPQIISYAPDKNGYTETVSNDVSFIVSILEPRLPGNSAISYSTVLNTCVGAVELPGLSTTDFCDNTDTPANTLITHYNLTLTLANGNYLWTSGSENYHSALGSLQQTSPNATYAGHDTRSLTVDVVVPCADNDNDTYSPDGGDCGLVDCDDNDNTVFPGADDFLCDGIDNNCDGVADDGYASTPTSCGVGVCAANGLLECVNGGEVDSCVEGTPGTEGPLGDATCSDGVDNDCDGATDAADSACEVVCIPTGGDDSNCDGIDDDCDGTPDNNYVTTDTTCGVGECASIGQIECVNGSEVNSCVEGTPATEVCDGVDNDCDGSVDEDYVPVATTCGVGECASTGETACVEGGEIDSCTPGTAVAEVCDDGLDNDCDGAIDAADSDCVICTDNDGDGYFLEGGDCGAIDCDDSDAAVNPGATEGPSGDPTCSDEKDNDCDGRVDSDDIDCQDGDQDDDQDDGRKMHHRHRRGHGG